MRWWMVRLLAPRIKYTEPVSFRDEKRILELVDQVAAARGSDRTAIYRQAIRLLLAKMGLLDKENLKILEGA